METIIAALTAISKFFADSRLGAVADKSAWLLMAPAIAALYYIDPAMATTLLQWSLYFAVVAGASVIVSRIVFPQIPLSELVQKAGEGNTAAGLVSAAVVIFVGMLSLSMVLWAKA